MEHIDNPEKSVLEEEREKDETVTGDEEEETPENTDEEEEEEEEEKGDEEDDDGLPEKFKGKSAAEIAESYRQLETSIDKKALEKAQEILIQGGLKPNQKKDKEEDTLGITEEELSKMTPGEFARWADKRIAERATQIAQDIVNKSNQTREKVRGEIKAAQEAHPHLKTNSAYREMVLDKIEAAQARGKDLSLKEACKAVDKAMDIKPGDGKKDVEEKTKKKPRTQVEKTDGVDDQPNATEEDKVREGMLKAGQSTDVLGGLGI